MNKNTLAYLSLISSMLIFSTIGVFRRYIPLPSGLLACLRGTIGAAFIVAFVKIRGRKLAHGIGKKNFLLLALTGAIIGFNWMFLFESYNRTTVAVATLCYYMEPTIVVLLSPLLLREKLTVKKGVCAAVSIAGMVLVSGLLDGEAEVSPDGIAFGLAAALLYSSVVILNKKIFVEDAYEKTAIQLGAAGLVMVPYLLLTGGFSGISLGDTAGDAVRAVIMTALVCIVHTGIAYVLYFAPMQKLNAQTSAVLSYIDPVSALILSALFLDEKLTYAGLIGAVMIIGAALVSEIGPKKKNNNGV